MILTLYYYWVLVVLASIGFHPGSSSITRKEKHAGKFFIILLSSSDFSQLTFLKTVLSGKPLVVTNSLDPDQAGRSVWPDRVQIVCKGYQQATRMSLVARELATTSYVW